MGKWIIFGKKNDTDRVLTEYTLELTDFLIERGMPPKDAYKLSKEFWKKNFKKIKEVYR